MLKPTQKQEPRRAEATLHGSTNVNGRENEHKADLKLQQAATMGKPNKWYTQDRLPSGTQGVPGSLLCPLFV